jgi:hypothetical protein
MNLQDVLHQLEKTRRSASELFSEARSLFEKEVDFKYVSVWMLSGDRLVVLVQS